MVEGDRGEVGIGAMSIRLLPGPHLADGLLVLSAPGGEDTVEVDQRAAHPPGGDARARALPVRATPDRLVDGLLERDAAQPSAPSGCVHIGVEVAVVRKLSTSKRQGLDAPMSP
ncbi:MAG: hypothetical protein U0U69_12590 [Acidimicrobiia bacterium]